MMQSSAVEAVITASPTPSSVFLQAAWGMPTERAPVWLMRQAGRYLPEYRALRERYDFRTTCEVPELAAEVTLQPVRRYAVDAAVIFTDIMIPALDMGAQVDFTPGPVVRPVRTPEQVRALRVPDVDEVAPSLGAAIAVTAQEAGVPVIGHAGAPLTFAAYLVTGRRSSDHLEFRTWLADHPVLAHELLDRVTETLLASLRMQIRAGAEMVQLFDSWVGIHDVRCYGEFGVPYVRRILDGLADEGVPRAYYVPNAAHLTHLVAQLPLEVVGVDWRVPLPMCRSVFGERTLQRNIDPAVLHAAPDVIERTARRCVVDGSSGPHIVNLGGGVPPDAPTDNVARLLHTVQNVQRYADTGES